MSFAKLSKMLKSLYCPELPLQFKAWLPFSPPVFSALFSFFHGNSDLLAIGVALMLLEIFEFLRSKIFLFLWRKKKSAGNPFYIYTILLPTIYNCMLFDPDPGELSAGPCVALWLSFHTWAWLDSCAQAARMPLCSCLMSGADAVRHEQWTCLDNSLPSAMHIGFTPEKSVKTFLAVKTKMVDGILLNTLVQGIES